MAVPSESLMLRALQLAERGLGAVEPNPLVGCVVARDGEIIAEGWHRCFGGPHAEIDALRAAGQVSRGATLVVNLEPCCHFGKTPPCVDAIIEAGIRRVVVGEVDPFEQVQGQGIARLMEAGIEVEVGVLESQARQLNAPFHKLTEQKRPWVIAKWAMSLDGKIATSSGESQWISGEAARSIVHQIRGRVDAVLVGKGTLVADNPVLTARPPGPRVATRIVLSSQLEVSSNSRLVQSADVAPVLIVGSPGAAPSEVERLQTTRCEVWLSRSANRVDQLGELLDELGRRRMTNVLVEGGSKVLGSLLEGRFIDEFHVFVSPRVIGGEGAPSPIGGKGFGHLIDCQDLDTMAVTKVGDDLYIHGRAKRPTQLAGLLDHD